MAESKIQKKDIVFDSYENITSNIPCTVPHAGFLKMYINPSTTSGGVYKATIYEETNVPQNYNLVAKSGEPETMVFPVKAGTYVYSATATGGTGAMLFKKASII